MKRTILLAVALLVAVSASAGQFRPASSPPAGVSRYRVTVAESVLDPIESVATELARTYGGRLEVYAEEGFNGFMITIMPERAELLSRDPRVVLVEEIPRAGGTVTPARPAPATPSRPASTAVAPPRTIRPDQLNPDSWSSGSYLYDAAGNITAIGNDTYGYDAVSRLTSSKVSGNSQSFSYDAFGNRTYADSLTGKCGGLDCAVDSNNDVDSATNRIKSLGTSYDVAGNMVTLDGGVTFVWDALSMMTSRSDGGLPQYIYDANDERIATYVSATGRWSWTIRDIRNRVLSEFTSSGTTGADNLQWQRDHIFRGSALLAATTHAGPTFHYHLDHLGSPRLVTSGGTQVAFHTYLPFGSELSTSPIESPEEVLKYTGHELDDVNSVYSTYYMHARSDIATLGRFLSVDPVHHDERASHHPQGWNGYKYTTNNPVSRLDPNGADDISVALAIAAVKFSAFFSGFMSEATDPGPALRRGTEPPDARTSDFRAGAQLANFMVHHDIVVEGSVSVGSGVFGTTGVSVINGNDYYFFFGGGYSYSIAPASAALSIGVVENYAGQGSYGGFFTSVSGPAPAAITIAGNPLNPQAPVSLSFTVSTDLGVSQAMTYYVPLSSLPQDVQDRLKSGSAYVFIDGEMYKATAAK